MPSASGSEPRSTSLADQQNKSSLAARSSAGRLERNGGVMTGPFIFIATTRLEEGNAKTRMNRPFLTFM
jgi:hypothetical protein